MAIIYKAILTRSNVAWDAGTEVCNKTAYSIINDFLMNWPSEVRIISLPRKHWTIVTLQKENEIIAVDWDDVIETQITTQKIL